MGNSGACVERTWFAVAPDGTEHTLHLRIGVPEKGSRGEWTCEVWVGVLDPGSHTVVGVDSWQAIAEGIRHVQSVVRHFESRGWRYFWERGGEPASPSELVHEQ
jgi:hypothetical protein